MKFQALVFSVLAGYGIAFPYDARDLMVEELSPEPLYSDYAPLRLQCPANQTWIRPAQSGISNEESLYVQGRKEKVKKALGSYLAGVKLTDFDVRQYMTVLNNDSSKVPIVGLAISGGAYAAALTGAGVLRAFDARFPPAVEQGTGGILQSMTYLSSLSGGAWPVMSLVANDFPEVDTLISTWQLNTSQAVNVTEVFEELVPKFQAGFNLSYMDFIGRAVGYQFLPGSNGGLGLSLSNLPELDSFKNHEMPFPMWQAGAGEANDVRFFDIQVPYANATIYEMNPFEFGAWNGPESFFPMRYLGTPMADGVPLQDCVIGFDRDSFILGVTADAFNFWQIEDLSNGTLGSFSKRSVPNSDISKRDFPDEFSPALIQELVSAFQEYFNYTESEAIYVTVPNPFALHNSTEQTLSRPKDLTLLDESEMFQSLPLWSQIQPARQSDFVIGWNNDEAAFPYLWNNGTSLHGTYVYALANNVPFPIVPEAATFINRNFTSTPMFFGCNANLTTTNDTRSPIVLWLPNAPYSSFTNYTGFGGEYSGEEVSVIMTNSFNIATQGNGTLDSEWPSCLACAVIDRSLSRMGQPRTQQCSRCFERYCWDGVSDNSSPPVLDLPLKLDPSWSYSEWNSSTTETYWPETPVRNTTN